MRFSGGALRLFNVSPLPLDTIATVSLVFWVVTVSGSYVIVDAAGTSSPGNNVHIEEICKNFR